MKVTAILSVVAVFIVTSGHCEMQETFPDHQINAKRLPQFLSVRAIEKRQLYGTCTSDEFWGKALSDYPQDCASEWETLTNALTSSLRTGALRNQSTATELQNRFSEFYCRSRCYNSFITSYIQCGSPEIADFFRGWCTRNSDGVLCYETLANVTADETQVQRNCTGSRDRTDCPANCRSALHATGRNHGCCLNVLNTTYWRSALETVNMLYGLNVTSSIQYDLWSWCGVATPGYCNLERSTLQAISTTAATTQSSAETLNLTKVLILLTSVVIIVLL